MIVRKGILESAQFLIEILGASRVGFVREDDQLASVDPALKEP
jgi:hypothetical protein